MDKRTSDIVHAFIHQERDENGNFTGHRRFGKSTDLYSRRCGYHLIASFDGPVFKHYDTAVGRLLQVPGKNKPVVLFHTAIRDVARKTCCVDGCESSKCTSEVTYMLRQAVDDQVPIGIPGAVFDAYCDAYKDWEAKMTTADMAKWHGDVINKFLCCHGEEFADAKDAQYMVTLLNDARKLNRLFKGSVNMKLVNKVQKAMDAFYAKKKVAKVPCLSYDDYNAKRDIYYGTVREHKEHVRVAENDVKRCKTLYNYCLNVGGRIDRLAARAASAIRDLGPLSDAVIGTVRAVVDLYGDDRYKELGELVAEVRKRHWGWGYQPDNAGDSLLIETLQPLFASSIARRSQNTETAKINWKSTKGRTISTSMGVTLDTRVTEAIHPIIDAILAGTDVTGRHIGPYAVREHTDEFLQVGCHRFRMGFVKKFCELYKLGKEEFASRRHELVGDWDNTCARATGAMLSVLDRLQQIALDRNDTNYTEGASGAAINDAGAAARDLEHAKNVLASAKDDLEKMNGKFRAMYHEDGTQKVA